MPFECDACGFRDRIFKKVLDHISLAHPEGAALYHRDAEDLLNSRVETFKSLENSGPARLCAFMMRSCTPACQGWSKGGCRRLPRRQGKKKPKKKTGKRGK